MIWKDEETSSRETSLEVTKVVRVSILVAQTREVRVRMQKR